MTIAQSFSRAFYRKFTKLGSACACQERSTNYAAAKRGFTHLYHFFKRAMPTLSFSARNRARFFSCIAIICCILLGCAKNDAEANQNPQQKAKQEKTEKKFSAAANKGQVLVLKNVQNARGVATADFAWTTADGKEVKFSEFTKGKPVFLNYWATWCPPCRKEIPDIIELAKEYGDKVAFIGVALENESSALAAQKLVAGYVEKNNINYLNLVGGNAHINDMASLFGTVEAIPTTFIFNKNGKLVQRIDGSTNKAGFLAELKKAL